MRESLRLLREADVGWPRSVRVMVGTAAWAIPKALADAFPPQGTALERYAQRFDAAEINSTFQRPHRRSTYERWRDSTPANFRFAVKTPRTITHEAALQHCQAQVASFLEEVSALQGKLGLILVQLPPKLAFDAQSAGPALDRLADGGRTTLALKPRHASWFSEGADDWLAERAIARVAADPARHPGAEKPGGWRGLSYRRLHGSPRVYYSAYGPTLVEDLGATIEADPAPCVWCVFDNTASGAATADALLLAATIRHRETPAP